MNYVIPKLKSSNLTKTACSTGSSASALARSGSSCGEGAAADYDWNAGLPLPFCGNGGDDSFGGFATCTATGGMNRQFTEADACGNGQSVH